MPAAARGTAPAGKRSPEPPRGMTRILVLLFAMVVLGATAVIASTVLDPGTALLGSAASAVTNPTGAIDPSDTTPRRFTVGQGQSAQQIGEELQRSGLIRSSLAFRFVVEQQNVGNNLTAGEYELSRSMSVEEIVTVLARGRVRRGLVVTIPEGWRAEQVADKLDAAGITSRDEFLRAVADPRSVPGVEILGEVPRTLEGYLFPWTYEVPDRVSGVQAAEMMVRMWSTRVGSLIRSAPPDTSLTPQQVLTLASIVEREAQQAAERPLIAGVYLNRLAQGMPLQADPTVQYAVASKDLGSAQAYGYWKRDLTLLDLQIDSPFNTYVRQGLPPAPICSPGEASVQAVLQPQQSDYLYFVATGDGSHLFAKTLAEHNQNVAKVNRP